MPIKTYTEEFKRDAVTLYENSPGTSIQTIATDLGVNRATLANWVKKYGTAAPTEKPSPASVNEAERIRQLEREVARLREERDILRKAAKISRKRRDFRSASSSLMTPRKTTRSSGYARC